MLMSRCYPLAPLVGLFGVFLVVASWQAAGTITLAQDGSSFGVGTQLVADGLVAPVDLEDDGAGAFLL